ncbi:MAG: nickel-type superoxide dismutase maturation protease [Acidimicrobiia bacterium]
MAMLLLGRRRNAEFPTRWFLAATAAGLAAVAAGRGVRRLAVEGDSMRPTLVPGDRLVAVRCRRPPPGALAVLADPRLPTRTLVKRVAAVGPGGVTVEGDAAGASTDSRTFGPVPAVWGRVVYRYGPRERAGRL